MAAALRASAAYRTNILHLVRPSGGVSLSHLSNAALGPPAFLRNGGLPKNRCGSSIEYSTNVGPGGRVMRWLSRRILAVLALAGLTGGALLVVSFEHLPYPVCFRETTIYGKVISSRMFPY